MCAVASENWAGASRDSELQTAHSYPGIAWLDVVVPPGPGMLPGPRIERLGGPMETEDDPETKHV
jgi:hypothetical protein